MGFFVLSFLDGFRAPLRGLTFLWRHRALWKLVWIPVIINALVFSGLGALFATQFSKLITLLLPSGDAWYWAVLSVLLWALGSALILVLFFLAFTVVGNAIAGPFNDILSERVEAMTRGIPPPPAPPLARQVAAVGRSVLESLKALASYLAVALLLLLWNLIPGAGAVIYTVASGVWTLLFLALEFGDYYLIRHRPRFRARWACIWSHRWASLGFGAASSLMLLVPLLNLLLLPVAVTGATLLWIRLSPPPPAPMPPRPAQ
jgi:CysZ protein